MTIEELELLQSMIDNCSKGTEYDDPDREKKAAMLEKLRELYLESTAKNSEPVILNRAIMGDGSCHCDFNCDEKFEKVNNGIAEIINKLEDAEEVEDEFTIKTTNFRKARLFMNIEKLMNALNDISSFRRDLYKGYCNDVIYMTEGHTYEKLTEKVPYKIPEDTEYCEGAVSVITVDRLIDRIDDIMRDYDIYAILSENDL